MALVNEPRANRPEAAEIVVCGHLCLDLIPALPAGAGRLSELVAPGRLVYVGPVEASTGGVVGNAGLALYRLGMAVRLIGMVGDDLFGRAVLDILRGHDPALAEGIAVTAKAPTSYTIVISAPGADRMFLHCPGANDVFGADDVPYRELMGARLFHFAYPPVMRRMYAGQGDELVSLLRRAREQGMAISLDMAPPDPASESGQAPWPLIMSRALPYVDLFVPTLDEILVMLGRPRTGPPDGPLLSEVAGELLAMGAAVVALKLGREGLYLRTSPDAERLGRLAEAVGAEVARWRGRELLVPCFQVEVVGTTGSGDCTVAGLLAALVHGLGPEEAAVSAVAVGACSVEAADGSSGVRRWEEVQARIAGGWKHHETGLALPGWQWDQAAGLWRGPHDVEVGRC